MPPEYVELIQHWGYWLMFFAAIIEGETFLILGGIAASTSILSLPMIFLLSLIGCIIHDCFFFFLGSYFGPKILKRKPSWKSKILKITFLFEKYDWILIIAFRFAWGLRTLIPFVLGLSKISNIKFFIFDIIGAIIWLCVFIFGGYYFGTGLMILIDKFHLGSFVYNHWIAVMVFICVLFFSISIFIIWYKKRRNKNKTL